MTASCAVRMQSSAICDASSARSLAFSSCNEAAMSTSAACAAEPSAAGCGCRGSADASRLPRAPPLAPPPAAPAAGPAAARAAAAVGVAAGASCAGGMREAVLQGSWMRRTSSTVTGSRRSPSAADTLTCKAGRRVGIGAATRDQPGLQDRNWAPEEKAAGSLHTVGTTSMVLEKTQGSNAHLAVGRLLQQAHALQQLGGDEPAGRRV